MADENIGKILEKQTAGMPNWVWLAVIVVGVGSAIIIPRFFGGGKEGKPSKPGTTGDDTDMDGIGLAVDPTTGLPYAVSGLVPSGAVPGGPLTVNQGGPIPELPSAKRPDTTPQTPKQQKDQKQDQKQQQTKPPPKQEQKPPPKQEQKQQPAKTPEKYVVVKAWPDKLSTLSGIASANGVSLQRVIQLNPSIKNPNLIYPGQKVRVA